MSSLPKNPKPNIDENKKVSTSSNIKPFSYDEIIKEMVELVRENKELIKKHPSPRNETIY